jgi:beta-glucosidase
VTNRRRFALAWAALLASSLALAQGGQPLYKDPAQPLEKRVADLLARMTLEEKLGQMTQVAVSKLMSDGWGLGPLKGELLERYLVQRDIGSVLSGGGMGPVPNTPRAWAEMTNAIQRVAVEKGRLGIPILYGVDAVHGHNNVVGATLYPHNLGLAATWNPALVEQIARRVGQELRATGTLWNFAPVADLGRDPRWGRFYETFGEDPLLAGSLVAATVRGLQASRVAATLKHFTGYGQPLGGTDRSPAFLAPRTLRDLWLPPFRAGLEAGALTVMANSGSVNGVPVHASRYLLTDVLRGEMGFGGVLISDWNDIEKLVSDHKAAADFAEAVAASVNAGIDVYMVPMEVERYLQTLKELVEAGRISRARIDEAVGRVLRLKFQLGLFEQPYVEVAEAERVLEARRSLAKQAALESITLLENAASTLPFARIKSLVVTGAAATDKTMQMGGWSIDWQGKEGAKAPGVTVLEGLQKGAPQGVKVAYADPKDAKALAAAVKAADAVVVALGEKPYAEGEGNNLTGELPAEQYRLLRELKALGKPVVLVLLAGRPLSFPEDVWLIPRAILMAYLPGSEAGGALAEVLFGRHNPSGRLPFTWPKLFGQVPFTYDRYPDVYPKAEPLYPFGYGLSYTDFAYRLQGARASANAVEVDVEVRNTGKRAGSDVVQLYTRFPPPGFLAPRERLVAFAKVSLEPGQSRTLKLAAPLARFALTPGDVFGLELPRVFPGRYVLRVGEQTAAVELGVDGR